MATVNEKRSESLHSTIAARQLASEEYHQGYFTSISMLKGTCCWMVGQAAHVQS